MWRALSTVALVILLGETLAGCEIGLSKRDAQVITVTIVGDEVRLDPSTVQAGKVWFTVQPSEDAARFPSRTLMYWLSDDDVTRLKHGTWPLGGSVTGIGPEGIVDVLRPGMYAVVLSYDAASDGEPAPPVSVAFLEVLATPGVSASTGDEAEAVGL